VEAGATNATLTEPLPAVAITPVGADGTTTAGDVEPLSQAVKSARVIPTIVAMLMRSIRCMLRLL
jgi:hypothetical protein